MVVLIDFAIQVINKRFLKVILVIVLEKLNILYFNFETLISNGL